MKAQRGAGFGIVSYIVMAVVVVLILIGGLLLVSSVTSDLAHRLNFRVSRPHRVCGGAAYLPGRPVARHRQPDVCRPRGVPGGPDL